MGHEKSQFSDFLIIVATGTRVYFPNRKFGHHNLYSLSRTKKFDQGR